MLKGINIHSMVKVKVILLLNFIRCNIKEVDYKNNLKNIKLLKKDSTIKNKKDN